MTTFSRASVLKPGYFVLSAAADERRMEFDLANEQLLRAGVRPDAVFIGDSITNFWELSASFSGVCINRGVCANTTTYLRQRFAADALQLRPRLIVLLIGTNDFGWLWEELDDARLGVLEANIDALAAAAAEASIPLALCAILPIFTPSYCSEAFAARKNAQIVAANARIRAIAARRGALYVDYHTPMLDAAGALRRELADDGVHPHAAGYEIMTRVLRETLAERGIAL